MPNPTERRELAPLIVALLTKTPDMTATEIHRAIRAPLATVKNYPSRMGNVACEQRGGLYVWRLYQPEPKAKAIPNSIDKMNGTYSCPELRRNPGLTNDRFEAFTLPRLINGVRMMPRRPA